MSQLIGWAVTGNPNGLADGVCGAGVPQKPNRSHESDVVVGTAADSLQTTRSTAHTLSQDGGLMNVQYVPTIRKSTTGIALNVAVKRLTRIWSARNRHTSTVYSANVK